MKQVYVIQSLKEGDFKIGVSKNPKKRLKQLQTGNSSELKLILTYPSEFANKIEKTLHNQLTRSREIGEWFNMSLTEALMLDEKCKKIEENIIILKKSGNVFI